MTRKPILVGVVALVALVGMPAVAGGADAPITLSALTDQIVDQSKATATATALVADIWVPRIAGLGTGLTLGLVVGGLVAYLVRGGDG